MFDMITEENDFCRGESDYDDGEGDSTRNIKKFRKQIEHLNKDLDELIYSGEDGEGDDVEECYDDSMQVKRAKRIMRKQSGKP